MSPRELEMLEHISTIRTLLARVSAQTHIQGEDLARWIQNCDVFLAGLECLEDEE